MPVPTIGFLLSPERVEVLPVRVSIYEFDGQLETGVDDRLNVCMVLRSDIRDSLFAGIDTRGARAWFIARTFKCEQVVWTGKVPDATSTESIYRGASLEERFEQAATSHSREFVRGPTLRTPKPRTCLASSESLVSASHERISSSRVAGISAGRCAAIACASLRDLIPEIDSTSDADESTP